jgi:hypothetical protein
MICWQPRTGPGGDREPPTAAEIIEHAESVVFAA